MQQNSKCNTELNIERKVHTLTYLNASVFENRLLLVHVKGTSTNEQPGVPKLVPANSLEKNSKGNILELEFINQPVDEIQKEKIDFEIKTVIDLGQLQDNLKGVKVIALQNADIDLF